MGLHGGEKVRMPVRHCALRRLAVFGCALFIIRPEAAFSEPLDVLLSGLLDTHHLTAAAAADLTSARERVREAMGGWYPQLNVSAHYGNEKIDKPTGTTDTNAVTRQLDITVTQLLWDFDQTPSTVRAAKLVRDQAEEGLEAARQNVLLRGIAAYLNVLRASEALEFARRSEENIKKQTELENARVKRGAGFSTDVLQAKTQLAGAQARRVQAEGAVRVARNGYRAMFYADAGPVAEMQKPVLPVDLLPATVEEAVSVAFQQNPQLRVMALASDIARETIVTTRSAGFAPRIDAVGELLFKEDEGGTLGHQNEQLAKVQLTWPFNLGFTAVNSVRAARSDFVATQERFADVRDLVEEQTRNAWENLRTARENAELLLNQANIAAEFLELARKERQLGRRSLLDVLAAETTLVNASSDAASAEIDVSVALFSLLTAMGNFDQEVLARIRG